MSNSSEISITNPSTNRSDEWETPNTPVMSRCGLIAPMWVAWKEGTADPERRFISCSRLKDKSICCRFFKWCDPPFTKRSREVILELKQKLTRNNEKIERLMEEIKNMQVENQLMSRGDKENEETKHEDILVMQRQVQTLKKQIVKKSSMEKKLWIVLVISWILIIVVLKTNV